jgi:rod shape-determining protein MreC
MEYTPPPLFNRGPTPLVRLFLCTLLSLGLLVADARYQYLDGIRQAVAVVVYPLQRLAGTPGAIFDRIGDFFVTQSRLRADNTRLAEQNLQNAARLRQFEALTAENAHLRELLAARQRIDAATTAAEVLYSGRDPFTRRVIIDKGLQAEVKAGQPVIDELGVIGQVTRVYPWLSEVTLITDKEQVVPVQNLRNGLRAVIAGGGTDGELELKFIPLNADFQTGDQLVTSGIDGVYPPGLPVARVSNVERNAAYLFARIVCKPVAGVTSHAQVLVVNWENKLPARPPQPEKSSGAKRRRGS